LHGAFSRNQAGLEPVSTLHHMHATVAAAAMYSIPCMQGWQAGGTETCYACLVPSHFRTCMQPSLQQQCSCACHHNICVRDMCASCNPLMLLQIWDPAALQGTSSCRSCSKLLQQNSCARVRPHEGLQHAHVARHMRCAAYVAKCKTSYFITLRSFRDTINQFPAAARLPAARLLLPVVTKVGPQAHPQRSQTRLMGSTRSRKTLITD
jgi:hypothetical protein